MEVVGVCWRTFRSSLRDGNPASQPSEICQSVNRDDLRAGNDYRAIFRVKYNVRIH
jgi:hypothetical protein